MCVRACVCDLRNPGERPSDTEYKTSWIIVESKHILYTIGYSICVPLRVTVNRISTVKLYENSYSE